MSFTRLYYSAVEANQYWKAFKNAHCKECLISYYFIQKSKSNDFLRKRKEEYPDVKWMIDSGKFSLAESFGASMEMDDYKKYRDAYLDYLDKNRDIIDVAVELDLEETPYKTKSGIKVFGYDLIRQWQEDYFIPVEKSGVPIIYVYHPIRGGMPEFAEMCKRHPWVGLSSDAGNVISQARAIARQNLAGIHGFGMTSAAFLKGNFFKSSDSTSWKSAPAYGTRYYWTGSKMITASMSKGPEVKQFSAYFKQYGLNQAKIQAGEHEELARLSLISWQKMLDALTSRYSMSNASWDLRPPLSEAISAMDDGKIRVWAERLMFLETGEDNGVEQDDDLSPEDLKGCVTLASAMLNNQFEIIKSNVEIANDLFYDFLKPQNNKLERLPDIPSYLQMEEFRKTYADVLMANNALGEAKNRTLDDFISRWEDMPRDLDSSIFDYQEVEFPELL